MKKMLCLAVFALGLAPPAVAEDWVLLGINSNNTTIFGDADSRTDNSAWFETRYTKLKKMISNGKFYNTAKALEEMDCSGKRFRALTVCKPPPTFALCCSNFCTLGFAKVSTAFALYRMMRNKKSDATVAFYFTNYIRPTLHWLYQFYFFRLYKPIQVE